MNDDKDKWIEEVFQSMHGSQRAKPRPELFGMIEDQIAATQTKALPLRRWRYAAAAAVVLLFVNVAALLYYHQTDGGSYEEVVGGDAYSQSLISTYQIYE